MKTTLKMILVFIAVTGMCVVLITAWLVFSSQQEATEDGRPQGKVPAGGSNWLVFRGSQELLGRASGAVGDSLRLVWKFKTGAEVKSSPAVDGGLVFIGSNDGNIYAIGLRTGNKVWAFQAGDAVEASPCVADGKVFVGSSDSFMYALDATSGALKWKYETGGQILGAANRTSTDDGKKTLVIFGSYDGTVYCVDGATGEVVW